MNHLLPKLVLGFAAGVLLYSTPVAAQVSPTTKKATRVRITQGPELEMTKGDMAIITWTSNNPGGSPEHFAVAHYGTDPKNLTQTAKSPMRVNPSHSSTVFRVIMDGLQPRTTYYYTVESLEANGNSDGVKSAVGHFTTKEGTVATH
jgi:phosphodiesterase/alkaline phosphatase D-like protein